MRYYQIKEVEEAVYFLMLKQCNGLKWIEEAFFSAWDSFKSKGWKYDGATFVREMNNIFWEVAAFIHDWLNHSGFVGPQVDSYFMKIMIALKYDERIISERNRWMIFTFINYAWHWLRFKNPKNELPKLNLK
ncbi:hypothetical protein [Nonlabens sp.]|jgi:hypothetical protein|uniref:hypothetical protein n=1 Tax=Nonlabens sp. TaxID=1888209 RepID=UPI0039E3B858